MGADWLMDSPLDITEIEEADRRKAVFREIGSEFVQRMKHGVLTDRPGTIARLMEKAYRAGLETGRSGDRDGAIRRQADRGEPTRRRMNDLDVPPLSRGRLYLFRLALTGKGAPGPELEAERPHAMALFFRPGLPGYPSTVSRDEWLLAFAGGSEGLGKKTVSPLIRLGLLDETYMEGGWRVATWSEWGFELLLRGDTSMPNARVPGGSSTFGKWDRLMKSDPHVWQLAAAALDAARKKA